VFRNNISQFRISSITAVRTSNLAFYVSNGRLVRWRFEKFQITKAKHLNSSTSLLQCRDQNNIPRALDFCTATLRHSWNYLSSDTKHLLKTLKFLLFFYLLTYSMPAYKQTPTVSVNRLSNRNVSSVIKNALL
jgi:hypothetical protein